jgi:hypothetical protein
MRWISCLGLLAFLAGCDASKAELESTKTTLSSVMQERDNLKSQLTALHTELDATKAELAKAKAPAPPPPAAAAASKTPAPTAAPAKAKAHKS